MVNLCLNLTGRGVPKLNMISQSVCEGVSTCDEIWISGLSKEDWLPPCGWASSSTLRDWREQKAEEGGIQSPPFFLPHWLSWTISHLLQPLGWGLYTNSPSSQAFSLRLNHWFPRSPVSDIRLWIVGLLSLYVHRSQFLVSLSHLLLLVLFLWRTLTNTSDEV